MLDDGPSVGVRPCVAPLCVMRMGLMVRNEFESLFCFRWIQVERMYYEW